MRGAFDEKSSKLDEAIDERNRLLQRLEEFEHHMADIQGQIVQHEALEAKLTEQKSKFEQLTLTQEAELAKYKERYESLLEELELVYLQKDELASELTAARSKLDVGKSVHALKLEQYACSGMWNVVGGCGRPCGLSVVVVIVCGVTCGCVFAAAAAAGVDAC